MADDKLPSDYDAIVLGTGMTECILAAALSRIGQSVLHLDRNDYYSGDWSAFHFESLRKWIAQQKGEIGPDLTLDEEGHDPTTLLKEGETTLPLRVYSDTVSSVVEHIHVIEDRPQTEQPGEKGHTEGQVEGHTEGQVEGHTEGQVEGHTEGQVEGHAEGQVEGHTEGQVEGHAEDQVESHTEDQDEGDSNTKTSVRNTPLETGNETASAVTERTHAGSSGNPSCGNDKLHSSDTVTCPDTDLVTHADTVNQMTSSLEALVANDVDVSTPVSTCVGETVEEAGTQDQEAKRRLPTFTEIKQQWRKFSVDLVPKVLYCRGAMVELLIKSDIAKYCEFKSVTRVLTRLDDKLQQVPCSRADVFASKQVSMIEKRMLMKLLTFCLEFDKHPDEYKAYEDRPFAEFLQSRKLTANVKHYVQTSIAMATGQTSTIDGLKSTQRFLRSLGRYGNTSFLWPLYGSGELPQCFCRMCAVFGGIYCLRRTARSLIVNESKRCTGIIDTEGQRLNCRWLIMESSYASVEVTPQQATARQKISRGILLTDRSIQPSGQEEITLLHLPVGEGRSQPVTVYELAPCAMACPSDFYLVHLTCQSTDQAETDLKSTVEELFAENSCEEAARGEDSTKPRVLWSMYFNMTDTTAACLHCHAADNVVVVSGPDSALDFDHSITQARKIFEQICGMEEDFLPAAPAPEDIIYDDEEGKTPADSGFSSSPGEEGSGDGPGNGKETSGDVIEEGEEEGRKTEEKREVAKKESGHILEGASQGEGEREGEKEGGNM